MLSLSNTLSDKDVGAPLRQLAAILLKNMLSHKVSPLPPSASHAPLIAHE